MTNAAENSIYVDEPVNECTVDVDLVYGVDTVATHIENANSN